MKATYFCKSCGSLAYVRLDNTTYCDKCGVGVELLVVQAETVRAAATKLVDESQVYGNDCPGGRCEF